MTSLINEDEVNIASKNLSEKSGTVPGAYAIDVLDFGGLDAILT